MEFHALLDFIQTRMRMAHIYQPVMIRTLLDHQGEADDEQTNRLGNSDAQGGCLDGPLERRLVEVVTPRLPSQRFDAQARRGEPCPLPGGMRVLPLKRGGIHVGEQDERQHGYVSDEAFR